MPSSWLWQSFVTHMVTIDIGVISSSHVDMVSRVVDIHGPNSQSAPLSSASKLGSAAGVQPSDRQLHSSAAPQSTIRQRMRTIETIEYRPQKSDHKRLLRAGAAECIIKGCSCNPPDPSLCGAAAANLFRLREVP